MKNIESMLCLSTAHLKPKTIEELTHDEIECCIYYEKIDVSTGEVYGGWLYISDQGDADDINAHKDLKNIVDYCDEHDINWIMFDSDIMPNPLFLTYLDEWRERGTFLETWKNMSSEKKAYVYCHINDAKMNGSSSSPSGKAHMEWLHNSLTEDLTDDELSLVGYCRGIQDLPETIKRYEKEKIQNAKESS